MFQIVKNVEIVRTRKASEHRKSKYPWAELITEGGIGAGFPVPADVKLKGFRTLAQKQGAARGVFFSVGAAKDGSMWVVYKGNREVDAATQEAAAAEAAAAEDALEAGEDIGGDEGEDGEGF